MRSLAARIIVGAAAWLALTGAAVFLIDAERQSVREHVAVRAFDLKVREATDALADLRAAQQAYVAAGQGVGFWMPKVTATADSITAAVDALRQHASSAPARRAIDDAAGTIGDFGNADKRAREYLKSGQQLMAADVIFTDGGQTAATAARQLEAARLAERQALDATEASRRRLEATVLGGAAAFVAIVVLLLVPRRRPPEPVAQAAPAPATAPPIGELPLKRPDPAPTARTTSAAVPALKAAAALCTELGRVSGVGQLNMLLGRAAEMMDASGLIVWVGDLAGSDLRAVLAHGYAPQVLARMPTVSRTEQNAAATAYRTGEMQIVAARPGASGAIVAPLLSPDGCIGALTAEVRSGGEASESVQALAAIFAAQLAGTVSVTPGEATTPGRVEQKLANG